MARAVRAFDVGYNMTQMFIRDTELMNEFERNRNKALRRFGSIVRRDARKSLKKKGNALVAIHLATGRKLHGAAATRAIAAGSAKPMRMKSEGPPLLWTENGPNLREILYGEEETATDVLIVIGPVAFGSGRPTVPEKLEHGLGGYKQHAFMGPAMERKRDQLLVSLVKFGVF